ECGQSQPTDSPVATGDKSSSFATGLRRGGPPPFSDGKPAQLRRTGDSSGDYHDRTTGIAGVNVNDTGLWEFIPPGPVFDTPPSCRRSVFDAARSDANPDDKTQLSGLLDICFADYQLGVGCFNNPCQGAPLTMDSRTEPGIDPCHIQLSR